MILTTRPATQADVDWIVENLRPEDAREMETYLGPEWKAQFRGRSLLSQPYAVFLQDPYRHIERTPTILFGCTPQHDAPGIGVVWMVATHNVTRGALAWLREARHWADGFCRHFPAGIHNFVDSRNDLHIRWLKYLGFEFGETQQFNGVDFHHFTRFS